MKISVSTQYSLLTILFLISGMNVNAFSSHNNSRRAFIEQVKTATIATTGVAAVGSSPFVFSGPLPANAAPEIVKTASGIKYAITKPANGVVPQKGDIVAIEYTGYLSNGQVSEKNMHGI